MRNGNEWSRSHDQDDCHAHIRQKPLKIFSRTKSPMILKLGMQHLGLKLCKNFINAGPGLTLTYFTERSNLDKISYCDYRNDPKFSYIQVWANSADPDQTAPSRAV